MYNTIVIGAGPAGYNCALHLATGGQKVLIIEKGFLGGTCLNNGCIPTKSLLKSSSIYSQCKHSSEFGVDIDATLNMENVLLKKNKVIEKLRKGIEFLIKKGKVDAVYGKAKFIDNNTISVGNELFYAENVVIASGTSCASLSCFGGGLALNSDYVLHNEVAGEEIVIIGGGVVGVELASYLNNIGKNVVILEYAPTILANIDADCIKTMTSSLKKQGIKIITSASVSSLERIEEDKILIKAVIKGIEKEYICDNAITCVGRKPNIDGLELHNAGVECNKQIPVNENCQTNVANIYAIGDISSKIMLAHYAEAEGINLASFLLKEEKIKDLSIIPSAIYTYPEIACVGKTEVADDCFVGSYSFASNGKANIEGSLEGFVKTVFDKNGIIIGGAIVCGKATDMISTLSLAIANKLHISDMAKVVYPHPTLSEGIAFSVEMAYTKLKNSIPMGMEAKNE